MEYPRSGPSRRQDRAQPGPRTCRGGQLLLVALLLLPLPAWAAPFTASTASELIDAILDANNETLFPGQDTITLLDNITVTTQYSGGAGGANGLPAIFSDIIIDGAGFTIARDTGDTIPDFRLFQVNFAAGNGLLTLVDVTVTGGSTGTGGAIRNNGGILALFDTTISGNGATTGGGGIYSIGVTHIEGGSVTGNRAWEGGGLFVESGTTTLTGTEVTSNQAVSNLRNGGGIFVAGGTTELTDSTVSANFAGVDGGGIFVEAGTATVVGTTVSLNGIRENPEPELPSYSRYGGGLYVGGGAVTLTNSTISTNSAEFGGGLAVWEEVTASGVVTLIHTTVAANIAETANSQGDYFDSIYIDTPSGPGIVFDGGDFKDGATKTLLTEPVTLVNSLVSNFSSTPHVNCNLNIASDGNSQVNNDVSPFLDSCGVDLDDLTGLVDTLADNGGSTETHALECGSSAIDEAGDCGFEFDQRGLPRPTGLCDVGSYELQGDDDPGDLYPIALHEDSLAGVAPGQVIPDIYNGVQPGNFGWLTWTGDPSVPALAASLTPPGDSDTYVNPDDPSDGEVSVGDWVQGSPGVSNAREIRDLLDALIMDPNDPEGDPVVITVPVWNDTRSSGNNSDYLVAAFARVEITEYWLPRDNMISARFLGLVEPGCPAD